MAWYQVETVKVVNKLSGNITVMNKTDFNPEDYTLWDDRIEEEATLPVQEVSESVVKEPVVKEPVVKDQPYTVLDTVPDTVPDKPLDEQPRRRTFRKRLQEPVKANSME